MKHLKETMDELLNKQLEISDEAKKISDAITALRDLCIHEYETGESAWENIGYDSHLLCKFNLI